MKMKIKKDFHFFGREKTPENKGGLPVFLLCAYSNNEKNVKITETVAIAVTKHPTKFGIKKL